MHKIFTTSKKCMPLDVCPLENGYIEDGISMKLVDVQPFKMMLGVTIVQYKVEVEITGSGF